MTTTQDGRLKVEDRLIEINGVSLVGPDRVNNSETMKILRRALKKTSATGHHQVSLVVGRRVAPPAGRVVTGGEVMTGADKAALFGKRRNQSYQLANYEKPVDLLSTRRVHPGPGEGVSRSGGRVHPGPSEGVFRSPTLSGATLRETVLIETEGSRMKFSSSAREGTGAADVISPIVGPATGYFHHVSTVLSLLLSLALSLMQGV